MRQKIKNRKDVLRVLVVGIRINDLSILIENES